MPANALFEQVLHDLGLAIVGGEIGADTRMTLSDLESKYGVSRTLARDVIRTTDALGLTSSRRRAGILVQPRSAWLVLDPLVIQWRLESEDRLSQIASLTDVREAIEPRAARLAAVHATDQQAELLVALAQILVDLAQRGLGRAEEYLSADVSFHSLLLEASGNEMLYAMRGMVADVLRGRAVHGLHPAWPELATISTHLQIAEAIRARNPLAAEAASHTQLEGVQMELGIH